MDHLGEVRAHRTVLISTIDVYDSPVGVDEESEPHSSGGCAYGHHRLWLEQFFRKRFTNLLIVRLPGLFGNGLKKNVIYDLLHDNDLHKVNAESTFQFYSLDDLWADIDVARKASVALVNFATEPVSVAEVARQAFGFEFNNPTPPGSPAHYDFRHFLKLHHVV
jgi:nucleoside-diphosphate-sugar epimerase